MSLFRSIWVFCLIGTVVAVLVTAIPILGILFAIMGVPYLSIILTNAGFVAMAVDAMTSRQQLLLLPPLLWFGGYTLVASISHAEVAALRHAAAVQNAHEPVRWNHATQPLLITKVDTSSENLASDITPEDFVKTYGLDEAYQGAFADAPATRVWLDHQPCPKRGAGMAGSAQYHGINRGGYTRKSPMEWADGVCLWFQGKAIPPPGALVVALASAHEFSGLVSGIEQDVTISGPDQPAYTVRAVQVAPLPWVPMLMMGCQYRGGLDINMDTDCHAEFVFTSWRDQVGTTPIELVTKALKLNALTIEQRLPGAIWR